MYICYNIVCVGCGGTGSFFIKEFARFMSTYTGQNQAISLAVIDGDRVEHNNLKRQCFMEEDINSFKATTMVSAVKDCFQVNEVYSYPFYLDRKEQLNEIYGTLHELGPRNHGYGCKQVDILIGCVDNHRARQVMHAYFKKCSTIFYFDSANEFSNGEVVFGGKNKGKIIGQPRAFYFPGILKSRAKGASEMSCGAINKTSPQHIVTNMLAANILLGKLIPLITDGTVSLGISYFDAFAPFINYYPYSMVEKKGEGVHEGGNEAEKKGEPNNQKKDKKARSGRIPKKAS